MFFDAIFVEHFERSNSISLPRFSLESSYNCYQQELLFCSLMMEKEWERDIVKLHTITIF